jgi:hypothetical protein
MDEGEPDEQSDSALGEGDFGEEDAAVSEEELEQMIAEAMRDVATRERKEREQSPEARAAVAFASEAGCTPEEARQILGEIERARQLRDGEGRLIRDRIVEELSRIVQENIVERLRYIAPVPMSRGHDLDDPVEAWIELRSGVADPTGFSRHDREAEPEQAYGGFDVVLVGDKSGSMAGEHAREQQRVLFLCFDALHWVAEEFKDQGVQLLSPVDVRFGLVSFQEAGAKTDLPLGSAWGPKEQVAVWRSLEQNIGGGTPDHLGMEEAGKVLGLGSPTSTAVEGEREGEAMGQDRVQIILEYSDGGSDDPQAFAQAIAALRKRGVIADSYRKDLAGFPAWVAEKVIAAAEQLVPQKVRK